jgi:hypothetical protein
MNSPATGLKLSAAFFAFFALAHAWRLVKQSEVVIGSHHIPLWFSCVAIIVGGILSIWMWKLSCGVARKSV